MNMIADARPPVPEVPSSQLPAGNDDSGTGLFSETMREQLSRIDTGKEQSTGSDSASCSSPSCKAETGSNRAGSADEKVPAPDQKNGNPANNAALKNADADVISSKEDDGNISVPAHSEIISKESGEEQVDGTAAALPVDSVIAALLAQLVTALSGENGGQGSDALLQKVAGSETFAARLAAELTEKAAGTAGEAGVPAGEKVTALLQQLLGQLSAASGDAGTASGSDTGETIKSLLAMMTDVQSGKGDDALPLSDEKYASKIDALIQKIATIQKEGADESDQTAEVKAENPVNLPEASDGAQETDARGDRNVQKAGENALDRVLGEADPEPVTSQEESTAEPARSEVTAGNSTDSGADMSGSEQELPAEQDSTETSRTPQTAPEAQNDLAEADAAETMNEIDHSEQPEASATVQRHADNKGPSHDQDSVTGIQDKTPEQKLNTTIGSGMSDSSQQTAFARYAADQRTVQQTPESMDTPDMNMLQNTNAQVEGARQNAAVPSIGPSSRIPVFQELVQNIVHVSKGSNTLGVTVEHESFGKLNIHLTMDKGMVNVHMNTVDKAVREYVENNIQQIVDSLDKDGVSVGEFSIALKNQGRGDGRYVKLIHGDTETSVRETKAVHRNSGMVSIFA